MSAPPTRTHRVADGECLHSIAERHGFAVETLWDHPANAALRARRGDPGMLVVGDAVEIPALREKAVACATDTQHRFRRRSVPSQVRVRLIHAGRPLADEEVTAEVDGVASAVRTDEHGALTLTVAPSARRLVVILPHADADAGEASRYEFLLGALPPVDTLAGLRVRLDNLGYPTGAGESLDPITRDSLRAFQAHHGVAVSGAADDATLAALAAAHDVLGVFPEALPDDPDD